MPNHAAQDRSIYASPRDEALHIMAGENWTDQISGDDDSPTGQFSRVSNYIGQMDQLVEIFGADLQLLGVKPRQLLGHFVLTHTKPEGGVTEYLTEPEAVVAFDALDSVYEAWRLRRDRIQENKPRHFDEPQDINEGVDFD